jgi:hypothetical protein
MLFSFIYMKQSSHKHIQRKKHKYSDLTHSYIDGRSINH